MKVEILPFVPNGTVTVPPSKSESHRALICAALSDGVSVINGIGASDDISATEEAVTVLGGKIAKTGDTVKVSPAFGGKNISVNFGDSGSTARFIIPAAAVLGVENARFTGSSRLSVRPVSDIINVLRCGKLSVDGESLPLTVSGRLRAGKYTVSGGVSSQFTSGLLMALSAADGESTLTVTSDPVSAGYVDLTLDILRRFGADISCLGNKYIIRGNGRLSAADVTVGRDWSQAAAFMCIAAVTGGNISLDGLDPNSFQPDRRIADILKRSGINVNISGTKVTVCGGKLRAMECDMTDTPDLLPVLAAAAAFADGTSVFKGIGRLALKESDRTAEAVRILSSAGIKASFFGDMLTVTGGRPHGFCTDAANDHRIAMALTVLASGCAGRSVITGAECVNKSFPGFFGSVSGLGAAISESSR